MPRIPDSVLDVAVYLYPTKEAANEGVDAGGTGFVIVHPFEAVPDRGVLCVVTNKHVVHNAPVIRLNRKDGGAPDIIDLDVDQWFYHRGPHDLALAVGVVNESIHKYSPVQTTMCLTRQKAKEYSIGVGDDIFMVGRFIGHEGAVHNEPMARFGNISADARGMENIQVGYQEESYAVDMKSKPGFSGSPTFVYCSPFQTHIQDTGRDTSHNSFAFLLGVNWGQIFEKRPLLDKAGKEIAGSYVKEASGMNGVVPSWHILSLLKQKEVDDAIKQVEARDINLMSKRRAIIEQTVAAPLSSDANPTHREDFMRLVGAAARKPAQED